MSRGANVNQHLSFMPIGKATTAIVKVRTGLGKTDRPGSKGGLRERDDMVWWLFATKLETADTLEAIGLLHARTAFYPTTPAPLSSPD